MTTAVASRPHAPPAVPLLGHAPMMAYDVLGYFKHLGQTYGDVVEVQTGGPAWYLVYNPADIEYAHLHTGRLFDKGIVGDPVLGPLLGHGLLSSEGDFWLRQRRLAQPAFHRGRIEGYAASMVEFGEALRARWQPGQERDIHADLMELTLEIVTRTLFSAEAGAPVNAVISQAVDQVLREYMRLQSGPERFVAPLRRRTLGRALGAVGTLDRAIAAVIQARQQAGERDNGDLLSMLLAARDDENAPMSERQLIDEVKTLISAGHETTANTLSWALLLLASHPAAESRLHAELDAVLGGRSPGLADLGQLPFLNAVIKETLRLYPAAWAVRRMTRAPWTVGGRTIPAGALVIMCQYATHRDPRFWTAPDDFRPERWLDPAFERSLPKYAYFPFGGGPRICIGQSFAQMESALLLATLLPGLRLRLAGPVRLEPSITLRPRNGLKMRLHAWT